MIYLKLYEGFDTETCKEISADEYMEWVGDSNQVSFSVPHKVSNKSELGIQVKIIVSIPPEK